MGTIFSVQESEDQNGIIQRAIDHLFKGIAKRQEAARNAGIPVPEFKGMLISF